MAKGRSVLRAGWIMDCLVNVVVAIVYVAIVVWAGWVVFLACRAIVGFIRRRGLKAHREGCCCFCGKSYQNVGPLAEGVTGSLICSRCAQACVDLISTERDWRRTAGELQPIDGIRVVAAPSGDAPEPIRRSWVGLTLPLAPGEDGPQCLTVSRESDGSPRYGMYYVVRVVDAISVLEQSAPADAAWWRENQPGLFERETIFSVTGSM